MRKKAKLMSVNRSRLYYKKDEKSIDEEVIKKAICELYEKHPFMGYRKITVMLRRRGTCINRKRVYRYMQELRLQAIFPKKNLSKRLQKEAVAPYLLRENPPKKPNDCWCTDITYIRMPVGFVYLIAFIDALSRKVMGWNCSTCLDTHSVLVALSMALRSGYKPKIINSDQGCQFTSLEWKTSLLSHEIAISMDGKGRCLDNIPIERFWRTLKYEEVFLKTYDSVAEARSEISNYIHWYNSSRPHQSLDYFTPDQIFFANIRLLESDNCLNLKGEIAFQLKLNRLSPLQLSTQLLTSTFKRHSMFINQSKLSSNSVV